MLSATPSRIMQWAALYPIFIAVFLAELGDKTQLATMLFATEGGKNPWAVFIASSAALVASSAIAVLLGSFAAQYLTQIPLKLIAGICFILIGIWTIWEYWQA